MLFRLLGAYNLWQWITTYVDPKNVFGVGGLRDKFVCQESPKRGVFFYTCSLTMWILNFLLGPRSPTPLHPRMCKYTLPLYCPVLKPRATPEWVRETGTPCAFEKYSSMLGDWSLFQGLNMFENSSSETRGIIDPGAVPFPNKNIMNLAMSLALLKTQESPQNRVHSLQKSTAFIILILTIQKTVFKKS